MEDDRLPSNVQTYLLGVLASLAMIVLCLLLGAAVLIGIPRSQRALVIIGSPDFDTMSDTADDEAQELALNFSFRSENEYRGLTSQSRRTMQRTHFLVCENHGGSGFLLTADVMVTAAHILPENFAGPVQVYCFHYSESDQVTVVQVEGELLAVESEFDVAFIRVSGCTTTDAETLELHVDLPASNERLHMFGFQKESGAGSLDFVGLHRSTSFIPNIPVDDAGYPTDYEGLAGLAEQGNSGGPIFNNTGAIVGMLIRRQADFNRSIMVPAFTIQSLLLFNGLLPEPENE